MMFWHVIFGLVLIFSEQIIGCASCSSTTWQEVLSQESIVFDEYRCEHISLNWKNNKGYSPLHMVSIEDKAKCVAILLKRNAKASQKDNDGLTPIRLAARNGSVNALLVFVDSSELIDELFFHPAVDAAKFGKTSCLKLIFSKRKAIQDRAREIPKKGPSILHASIQSGNLYVVKTVVDLFDSMQVQEAFVSPNESDETVLHIAAQYGGRELFLFLLQHPDNMPRTIQSRLSLKTKVGRLSNLHLAAKEGNIACVRAILEHLQHLHDPIGFINEKSCTLEEFGNTWTHKKGNDFMAYLAVPPIGYTFPIFHASALDFAVLYGHGDVALLLTQNSARPSRDTQKFSSASNSLLIKSTLELAKDDKLSLLAPPTNLKTYNLPKCLTEWPLFDYSILFCTESNGLQSAQIIRALLDVVLTNVIDWYQYKCRAKKALQGCPKDLNLIAKKVFLDIVTKDEALTTNLIQLFIYHLVRGKSFKNSAQCKFLLTPFFLDLVVNHFIERAKLLFMLREPSVEADDHISIVSFYTPNERIKALENCKDLVRRFILEILDYRDSAGKPFKLIE